MLIEYFSTTINIISTLILSSKIKYINKYKYTYKYICMNNIFHLTMNLKLYLFILYIRTNSMGVCVIKYKKWFRLIIVGNYFTFLKYLKIILYLLGITLSALNCSVPT